MTGTHTRNEDGLLPQQAKWLEALAEVGTWDAACERARIVRKTVNRWMRDDDAFRAKYTEIFGESMDATKKKVEASLMTAADVLDKALGALKSERKTVTCDNEVTCPQCKKQILCGHKITVVVEIDDIKTQMAAAMNVLRTGGMIIERVQHEAGPVTLTYMEALARATLIMGGKISPQLRDALKRKNALPEPEEIIEGEFRELPEGGSNEVDTATQQQS